MIHHHTDVPELSSSVALMGTTLASSVGSEDALGADVEDSGAAAEADGAAEAEGKTARDGEGEVLGSGEPADPTGAKVNATECSSG